MKKYYSPVKPYYKRRRIRPVFQIIKGITSIFFKRDKIEWRTEEPTEPVFFVSNHTKVHAPINWILSKKPKARLWANCYFLSMKEIKAHLIDKVLIDRKALKPLAYLLMPLVIDAFRGINPVPVYHDMRVKTTFDKSIETLEEGLNLIVFPERTENPVNDYIYQFNRGFVTLGQHYYKKTGKLLKFYPVYCCKALHLNVVGEPITYDPNMNGKEQRETVCLYLENAIKELAESLPKHEIEFYG